MAQHDYNIANQSGAAFRQDLNNALEAIVSQNSGTAEPSTTYAYQWWADTTAGVLKQRNAANSAWITIRELDGDVVLQSGAAATPSLYFDGDANTGVFSPGADEVAVATGGVSRLVVNASGQAALGAGTAAAPVITTTGDTDTGVYFPAADTIGMAVGGAEYLRLASSSSGSVLSLSRNEAATSITAGELLGRVTFGDSSQNIYAQITAEADATAGASDYPGRLIFAVTGDGGSSPLESLVIDSEGTLYGSGAFASKASFHTTGRMRVRSAGTTNSNFVSIESWGSSTATRHHFSFSNGNGVVGSISTNGTATAYNTSSDYRLKENVVLLTGAIDRLQQIPVHRFNFIADPDKTVDGFIAHEAQAVVPECVTGVKDEVDEDNNPVYQGIDQSKLVPLLTAALQEAIAEIASLKDRVAALEAS